MQGDVEEAAVAASRVQVTLDALRVTFLILAAWGVGGRCGACRFVTFSRQYLRMGRASLEAE